MIHSIVTCDARRFDATVHGAVSRLFVDGPAGAPVVLPVVPGRAGAELFPVLDSAKTREIAADVRALVGLS